MRRLLASIRNSNASEAVGALIFDDALNALDYESERVVQENMRAMAWGRTVIIIAHRLAAVREAERIITIDRGGVVEDGTQNEFVRSNGRYPGFWQHQVGYKFDASKYRS